MRGGLLVAAILGCVSGAAQAQTAPPARPAAPARCDLIAQESTHVTTSQVGGQYVAYAGGGVLIRCPDRGITLRGDSAEQYPDRDYLVGHVSYDEPRFAVTSQYLTYFTSDERVVAAQNVHAKLPNGSTLVGPQAEYRRPDPRFRPHEQILAIGRPTITVAQADSLGRPQPPMTVVANTVFMDGDSLMYGSGQVLITRTDVRASGDSVAINSALETMRLMRGPSITSTGAKPFTLTGGVIDAFSHEKKLQRVVSRSRADATTQDMNLRADTIELHVRNDSLQRAIAWGNTLRARAVSPTETLVADSIDVDMPHQRIRVLNAVRKAYASSRVDSTRFRPQPPSDTLDWLRGDVVVAHFDTTTHGTPDTSSKPVIKQLVATGHAAAEYHMAGSDTTTRAPAINYTRAGVIVVTFDSARVATVAARDSVVGVYLEPAPDSTKRAAGARAAGPRADSSRTRPRSIVPLPVKRPPARREQ